MTIEEIFGPSPQPEVLGEGFGFTEGPAADAEGNVYFSDGRNDSIFCYRPGRGIALFADDSTDANGMMFNACGELYVCEGAAGRVVAFDVATRQKRILCSEFEGLRFNEPNDLAVDRTGGFYFSDPNYQHHGQPTVRKEDVYYCSAAGEVSRVSTVCFKPNGVLLSEDGSTLYVADARGQRIFRYRVAGPGRLADESLWIDGLSANPDGMTLDEHDNLFICCGKAGLKVFDRNAQYLGTIEVHAANTCFGAPEWRTLYVASGSRFVALLTRVRGIRSLPALDAAGLLSS